MPEPVQIFSTADPDNVQLFYQQFFQAEEPEPEEEEAPASRVIESLDFQDLIGVDPALSALIEAALRSKQHLIIHGPPGTGKTTLARKIAEALGEEWVILTATSDWTAHELIGGYMPDANGSLQFVPGAILFNFSKVTIIDEFNRADIDKAFGPLFSILSDQPVVLPYLSDPSDPDCARVEVLPRPAESPATHQWAPSPNWRLICTLNTYDKASLFQMSYALARRFAWIHLDVPKDLAAFVTEYAAQQGWGPHPITQASDGDNSPPIAQVWAAINEVRPLGPAPIIDVMATILALTTTSDASTSMDWRLALIHALSMFVVPQLEGIDQQQAQTLAERIQELLNPEPDDEVLKSAVQALRSQLMLQAV